jgi:site-specific recombinase XerD
VAEHLLHDLLPSWRVALQAQNKSPRTLTSYTDGVRAYLTWCKNTGTAPDLTKTSVQAFTASLLEAGAEPATAKSRHASLRRYAAWLAEEGEIASDPLIGLKPPKLFKKVTDSLSPANTAR